MVQQCQTPSSTEKKLWLLISDVLVLITATVHLPIFWDA